MMFAGLATAQTAHGATPPTGGAQAGPAPRLRAIQCRTACAGVSTARPGSRVRVIGRGLLNVGSVVFEGGPGAADDVAVDPLRIRRRYVDARVPRTAVTGPVELVSADGAESAPSPAPLTIDATAPVAPSSSGGLKVDVEVQGSRVFYGAARQAQVSFLVRGPQAANVTVELVRLADGVAITHWDPGMVQPDTPQTVTWDGTAGGRLQRNGRYAFQVTARAPSGATASSSQAPVGTAPATPTPGSFLFQRNIFPIRGAHTFGTGTAAFGGGRHHQGQDVFAACGTPLVATRAGVIKYRQYQSRAGNYIVIDPDHSGNDYAYMHMREPALVKQGQHVYTGQLVGHVGDTGHADGCHLHFELWTPPGWYSGGHPVDPLPSLLAWDRTS